MGRRVLYLCLLSATLPSGCTESRATTNEPVTPPVSGATADSEGAPAASTGPAVRETGAGVRGAPHGTPIPMLGASIDQDAILAHLQRDAPLRFRPIGSTSIVYEVLLDGPVNAAYKPRSRSHPAGHLAEIAAYRVARSLELDNVPPAVTRRISKVRLFERLHPDFADAWDEIDAWTGWNDDGTVDGAAIYWIPEMRDMALDRPRRMTRWAWRLSQRARLEAEDTPLHADLSNMVAFDFLIGNWDRFSGGNVTGLPSEGRLFIRDHNVAFAPRLSEELDQRILGHLERTEKFSARFVRNLMGLTEARLRAELRLDPGAAREPALTNAQIREVMERRQTLISYIASLAEMYGDDRVLAFP